MRFHTTSIAPLLWLTLVLATGGCANAPLSVAAMVPHEVEIARTFDASLSVRAHGSEDPWIGSAVIPSEDLQAALVEAIGESKVFRSIGPKGADWELTVTVSHLVEPETGLDMSATVELEWLLVRSGSGAVGWMESLRTSELADTFDADFMDERRLIAIQGAVRKNIEQGIAKLSLLQLDGAPPGVASTPAD